MEVECAMTNTYKTAQVAKKIGIHPNTVRLYEELELIPKPQRQSNGYRVFTEFHVEQFQLARTAFKVEVLQNGLRKKMISIIKLSAKREFQKAINLTKNYLEQIKTEQSNAEEAIVFTKRLLTNTHEIENDISLTRKQVADYLQITMDTLRNWEMNGLLIVKRKQNGYRTYNQSDIRLLKIIRCLRCANYSLAAILRMLNVLSINPAIDIRQIIDTPTPKIDDDIVSACDKLLTSLKKAEENAISVLKQLQSMQEKYYNNPTL